jgi:hypothetical protein
MAAGHGGQILLDGATAGLMGEEDLIALGPKRLRDIAKPIQIYQVHVPGLRAEFPPLNALPGHLLVERVTLRALHTFLDEIPSAGSAVSRRAEVGKFGSDSRWVGRDTGAQR